MLVEILHKSLADVLDGLIQAQTPNLRCTYTITKWEQGLDIVFKNAQKKPIFYFYWNLTQFGQETNLMETAMLEQTIQNAKTYNIRYAAIGNALQFMTLDTQNVYEKHSFSAHFQLLTDWKNILNNPTKYAAKLQENIKPYIKNIVDTIQEIQTKRYLQAGFSSQTFAYQWQQLLKNHVATSLANINAQYIDNVVFACDWQEYAQNQHLYLPNSLEVMQGSLKLAWHILAAELMTYKVLQQTDNFKQLLPLTEFEKWKKLDDAKAYLEARLTQIPFFCSYSNLFFKEKQHGFLYQLIWREANSLQLIQAFLQMQLNFNTSEWATEEWTYWWEHCLAELQHNYQKISQQHTVFPTLLTSAYQYTIQTGGEQVLNLHLDNNLQPLYVYNRKKQRTSMPNEVLLSDIYGLENADIPLFIHKIMLYSRQCWEAAYPRLLPKTMLELHPKNRELVPDWKGNLVEQQLRNFELIVGTFLADYARQKLAKTSQASDLAQQQIFANLNITLPTDVPLYIYEILYSSLFIKKNGYLILYLPSDWLQDKEAETLQQFLVSNFELKLAIYVQQSQHYETPTQDIQCYILQRNVNITKCLDNTAQFVFLDKAALTWLDQQGDSFVFWTANTKLPFAVQAISQSTLFKDLDWQARFGIPAAKFSYKKQAVDIQPYLEILKQIFKKSKSKLLETSVLADLVEQHAHKLTSHADTHEKLVQAFWKQQFNKRFDRKKIDQQNQGSLF